MGEDSNNTRTNNGRINDSKISTFIDSLLTTVKRSGYSSEDFAITLTEALYTLGMFKTWFRDSTRTGGWKLRNDIWSPYYIDLRPLCSYRDSNKLLGMIGATLGMMIEEESPHVNKVLGIASAGVPISTAITGWGGIPSCWTRKLEDIKSIEDFDRKIGLYGGHAIVEGVIEDGDRFAAVDDVITGADSKKVAIRQLYYQVEKLQEQLGRELDVRCEDVYVIIDREQGGKNILKEDGINLYSLIKFSECIEWLNRDMIWDPIEYEVIKAYHNDPTPYQNGEHRKELEDLALNESPYLKIIKT